MTHGIKLTTIMEKTGAIHPEVQRFVKNGWVKVDSDPCPSGKRSLRFYTPENQMRIGLLHVLMEHGIKAQTASAILNIVDRLLQDLAEKPHSDIYNPLRWNLYHKSTYVLYVTGDSHKVGRKIEWQQYVHLGYKDSDSGEMVYSDQFGPLSLVPVSAQLDKDGFEGDLPLALFREYDPKAHNAEFQHIFNLTAISDRLK